MKPILRSLEYFQDLHVVVPDHASSLTRGNTGVSPTDAGIKMFIAPSAEASLFHVLPTGEDSPKARGSGAGGSRGRSPSPDMPVTPSTIVQMRAGGAQANSGSPLDRWQRSPSPPTALPPQQQPQPSTTTTSSSSLSPFAVPYCPPSASAPSSAAQDAARTTRNYSPTLLSAQHHLVHQQMPQTFMSYYPSPVTRLENSFCTAAVGGASPPVTSNAATSVPPSLSQPQFAPPPPYKANNKQ